MTIPHEPAKPRRGGRRPGAGAPRGNLNAFKHGRYSRQFAELGAIIAASPAARDTLLRIAQRQGVEARKADQLAAYVIRQVVARGLVRGRDRLILLPPIAESDTINRTQGHRERKNTNRARHNQAADTNPPPQSKPHEPHPHD